MTTSADDPHGPGGPIVVGVDGSSNAQRALTLAARLARSLDVDLAVFHALGLMTVVDGEHVPSEGHREEIERTLVSTWCSALTADPDLRWSAAVVLGSPTDVLLSKAHELDASFVVVGSRGTRTDLQLGSTSLHVVHHCDRPVVVVPPVERLSR